MEILDNIKKFDAYPRTMDDFTVKTHSGAIVSILCCLFVSWLFFSELIMSVDTMDIAGQHQLDVVHNIFKSRLNLDGSAKLPDAEKQGLARDDAVVNLTERQDPNYCGPCYGAESHQGECCNTCEQVREVYRKKGWAFTAPSQIEQCVKEGFLTKLSEQRDEGCKIYGYILVNKVAGNFHFAPGKSFQSNHMHFHDMEIYKMGKGFNLSHTVNRLSFGPDIPGLINPLDKVQKFWTKESSPMYQYFIKIVPTTYEDIHSLEVNTNQFSVTEYERSLEDGNQGSTGVFFLFELSPIRIIYRETSRSLAFFLTGICAIIGGVFTVAGLIDSFIYRSLRSLEAKIELGKDQ